MLKERYRKLNASIVASPLLINRTLNAAKSPVPRGLPIGWLKKLIPIAALLLTLTFATPALATNVPAFNDLLYRIAPAAAMYFRPINLSCEDEGVIVELMAININGDTAEMYISVQGDAIDGTVDLYDSYHLDTPKDASAHCQQETYLPESKTAVFYVNYRHMDGSPIDGQKLTFAMSQMLVDKQEYTMTLTHLLPQSTAESTTFRPAESLINGRGGEAVHDPGAYQDLLVSGEPLTLVDGVLFTGSGYVDGKLHIQLRYQDVWQTDNHGFLELSAGDGHPVHSEAAVHFRAENDSVVEYIFNPAEIPDDPVLTGDFVTCDTLIQGDWQITFPLVEYAN